MTTPSRAPADGAPIDDGGPVAPWYEHNDDGTLYRCHPGMSVRDYFAGQALAGMLAHSTRYQPRPGSWGTWHNAIAVEAYELADAMLAARKAGATK